MLLIKIANKKMLMAIGMLLMIMIGITAMIIGMMAKDGMIGIMFNINLTTKHGKKLIKKYQLMKKIFNKLKWKLRYKEHLVNTTVH